MRSRPRRWQTSPLISGTLLIVIWFGGLPARSEPPNALHYTPNHNFDTQGRYAPGNVGFNLADVSHVRQLELLPNGVKGLVWIGQCNGTDAAFLQAVRPFLGRPNVFGFYLMDEPDPTGRYKSPPCKPENLKAESDWIHAHAAGAKTFVVLMNLGSSDAPSFIDTYNHTNSHIDLFGIDPYPCRSDLDGCEYDMIDRHVAAAEAWGIPRGNMVPVYQAFGGGHWRDDRGGKYALPTVEQMKRIIERWDTLVAAPAFDFAYSWGSQKDDQALADSPELKAVFARRNAAFRP